MKGDSPKELLNEKAVRLQRDLATKFPDLTVSCAGSKIYIRGSFPVMHEGKVLDRYQIEIGWSDSDTEAPVLCETDGQIPWIADRHMSIGGKACLFVPEEWLMQPRDRRTVIHYLDGPVRNYFLWQGLFERGHAPPWGERSHGVRGLLEAYGDLVGVNDEKAVRTSLEYLAKKKIKTHWPCLCGSGSQLRDCHIEHLRNIQRKVPRYIAKLALNRLEVPTIK